MTFQKTWGTPGAPNSRLVANAGPAIYDVEPFPILPAANEPVVVSARVDDPDGVANVTLQYRIDPSATIAGIPMRDDGTDGDAFANDGIYSATIPGQPNGALVAFRIQAQDAHSGASQFPSDAPARECLIHYGETLRSGTIGSYRFWLTQSNLNYWAAREKNSNEGLDATFVYGNWRVIYDAQALYSGSPWHTPVFTGPLGYVCNYELDFPSDDLLLGGDEFDLEGQDFVESQTFNNDASAQAETTAHWMGHKIGVRPDYRRDVAVYLNGQQRGMIYYDYQQPDGDLLKEYFPDDSDGHLYKIEDWFEFDDAGSGQNTITARMLENNFNGQKRTERYRWNFRPRATDTPNDFAELYSLINAVNAPAPEPYTSATLNVADIREWARMFALEHMVGNWDSYGYERGKNMFIYKPTAGPWELLLWDIQLDFGKSSLAPTDPILDMASLTDEVQGGDPTILRLLNHPPFAREFWEALQELVNGPMAPENYQPLMDARVAALRENNIPVQDPAPIKSWIAARRSFIQSQIPPANFSVSGPTSFNSSSNAATLMGSAPIGVTQILVNGIACPLTWTAVTSWSLNVPLNPGSNPLNLTALDENGNPVSGDPATVTVNFTGTAATPEGHVVLNEIMNDAAQPGNDFVELFNADSTDTFDLSGWQVDELGYTFPAGSILAPGNFLVLAKDKYAFAAAYGGTNIVFDQFGGSLDPVADTLTIFKPAGITNEVVDRVRYETTPPWPSPTNGESLQLVDAKQDNSRVANWATTSGSPGAPNSVAATLPVFPSIWLNEVEAENISGPLDNVNEHDPWVELYNSSASDFDLTGYYLADNYTNVTQWEFPAGTSIPADGFLVVWCDNQTGQSAPNVPHAAFRLAAGTGSVVLARITNGTPQVVDYLNYSDLAPNSTYGDFPDGQPFFRQEMNATPGASNSGSSAPISVFINEWMADNAHTLADPADGDFADWFELYNPGATDADLGGYYLTDDLSNKTKFQVPNNGHYVVPAHGFLLVWADSEASQNSVTLADLHTSFSLSKGGEAIGLFASDGTQVDAITFGAQTTDVSQGRFPDATGPVYSMNYPTPGALNTLTAPTPPQFGSISVSAATVSFSFSITPGKLYRVEYTDNLAGGVWTASGPDTTATNSPVVVQENIGSHQQRFYRVVQLN